MLNIVRRATQFMFTLPGAHWTVSCPRIRPRNVFIRQKPYMYDKKRSHRAYIYSLASDHQTQTQTQLLYFGVCQSWPSDETTVWIGWNGVAWLCGGDRKEWFFSDSRLLYFICWMRCTREVWKHITCVR